MLHDNKTSEEDYLLHGNNQSKEKLTLSKKSKKYASIKRMKIFLPELIIHNFCTIISKDSLYRGLVFHSSILKYDKNFRLFMICLQDEVRELLEKLKLKNVILISVSHIEDFHRELLNAKYNRDEKEYAWTIKAPLILYIFKFYSYVDSIVYMDADTHFYSNPQVIFDELEKCSIMITRERFLVDNSEGMYSLYGYFNGGFLGFKKDENSIECLKDLAEKCVQWCKNTIDSGRYGDQAYLSEWPTKFKNVYVSENYGINVTAWYSHASNIEIKENQLFINYVPIIFYHYSGLVMYNKNEFDLCCYMFLPPNVVNLIYSAYINKIVEVIHFVSQYDDNFYNSVVKSHEYQFIRNYYQMDTT